MSQYTYENFIKHNPDAMLIAERKLHPELKAMMRIYYYEYRNHHDYIFRYEDDMVTNRLSFEMPIPENMLPLLCYEWFNEYEEISNVKEMFKTEGEWYNTPRHLNIWNFSIKWERRYGHTWSFGEGEHLRKYKRKQALKYLNDVMKDSSKEEMTELKEKIGEMIS